ncbi:sulfite reductase flavoprotein subunit alpha [Uliginosibacterium sp. TH139]|uniref:PepSY domain-containing protein n=1 Tax=Uliginosibacterium sp. TH139 TaxID=2067453 RepID=UPI000C7B89EA|nr:sulfite reductase flavoprotein subunit alpha [Uliginosibacterium sp. TH139]PLK47757.1 nitric oxide synthase [Uliginosibacterium sp. TH139]
MSRSAGGVSAILRWSFFQLHWLIGITAGSLLMLIGLSGAMMSFEEEILDMLNPGLRSVPVQSVPMLAPPLLLPAVVPLPSGERITTAIFSAEAGRSVQLLLQTPPGASKLLPLYVHPYTGQLLGEARGQAFFEWIERLHRFFLLPREPGRVVAGILSSSLLLLIASGLYLRWPRRPLDLRTWLGFNPRLKGRPFLWSLHAVLATWALPAWLLLTATGIYWSFDSVRSSVDSWAGIERAPRVKKEMPPKADLNGAVPDISLAWQRFADKVPAWRELRVRPPETASAALEILWLLPDAAHQRERNRMLIALDGKLKKDERFAEQSTGKRVLAMIHPLHMGRDFGLAVQLFMMLSALALPVLGVTGWLLYLSRRRGAREAERQRKALLPVVGVAAEESILVAWASQTGRAESLALRTAAALQAAGRAVVMRPLASLQPAELAGFPQALFVVSTFGEGEAPDTARGFARALGLADLELERLRFAVLALGNRQYRQFCGFGHSLQAALLRFGAQAWQPLTPACETEPAAVEHWFAGLKRFGVRDDSLSASAQAAPAWEPWRLAQRTLLNPGSSGSPLFELTLLPAKGELPHWTPGALVEILPCPHLCSVEPDLPAPRRYSIASIHEDGCLQLIVRQHHHALGIGLASGFLTLNCPLDDELALRLQANPSFTLAEDDSPSIFIGNGSGIAGLRGLLRERVRRGFGRNWLVFGERHRATDSVCETEFGVWVQAGLLEVDRVFSREPGGGHVQDFLRGESARLMRWLGEGAVIHVCGSLQGMAGGVDAMLEALLGREGLDLLIAQKRYRRDVY